jgi:hypothetical protein
MSRRGIDAARQEVGRAGQIMNNTFRFIRYLGNGGQGMVSLWEYRPGPRQVHRLVLKVSTVTKLGPGPNPKQVPDTAQVEREKDFMTVSSILEASVQMLIRDLPHYRDFYGRRTYCNALYSRTIYPRPEAAESAQETKEWHKPLTMTMGSCSWNTQGLETWINF